MSTVIDDDRDAAATPEATPPTSKRRPLLLTDAPQGRRLTLPAALVLAAASGLLAVLAFPPYGIWPLAAVSVAGLGAAVHRRRLRGGLGVGFVYGLAFFLPLLAWSSTQVGQWPWLFLCALEALGMGLLGMGLAACSRLIDTHRWTWAPLTGVAWVAEEALRSRQPFGGFPWGNLAFSQADAPTAAAIWLGGAPFLSFLVALSGGFLLAAGFAVVTRRTAGIRKAAAFTAAAALTALAPLALPIGTTAPAGETINVAVVQGNVPRLGLGFNEQRRAVLDNHVQATQDLADAVNEGRADRPDLVMWPENASDIDPLANEDAYDAISQAAAAIGAPIVLGGIVHNDDGTRSNMTIVWDPEDGPVYMYSKRHPVPFAEYVPYKAFFSTVAGWIDPRMSEGLDNVAGFEHGQNPGIVESRRPHAHRPHLLRDRLRRRDPRIGPRRRPAHGRRHQQRHVRHQRGPAAARHGPAALHRARPRRPHGLHRRRLRLHRPHRRGLPGDRVQHRGRDPIRPDTSPTARLRPPQWVSCLKRSLQERHLWPWPAPSRLNVKHRRSQT